MARRTTPAAPTVEDRCQHKYRQPLEPGTWSLEEACALLGIGTSTGYRLFHNGEFPVRVRIIGSTRKVLKSDMARYLNGETSQAV